MLKKYFCLVLVVLIIGSQVACGSTHKSGSSSESMQGSHPMSSMAMDSGSSLPAGLKKAAHPKFPKGSRVILLADHMPGMNHAKATIVAAYRTHVYSVTYKPMTGGKTVRNHKWVVQQELATQSKKLLPTGAKVKLNANHMQGMRGATGRIDTSQTTTVYIVNYKNTKTGKLMKDHKWVIESELKAR
ncbi:MAG: YdhK family protein [Sporolactobacillus sp.]